MLSVSTMFVLPSTVTTSPAFRKFVPVKFTVAAPFVYGPTANRFRRFHAVFALRYVVFVGTVKL